MGSVVSYLLHYSERLAMWLTCTVFVSCMMITIVAMLSLGIGLGYNYCFVDHKSRAKYRFVPGQYKKRPPPRPHLKYPHYARQGMLLEPISVPPEEAAVATDDAGNANLIQSTTINILPSYLRDIRVDSDEDVTAKTVLESTTRKPDEVKTSVGTKTVLTETKKTEVADVVDKKSDESTATKKVRPMAFSITGLDLIALLSQLRAENRNYSVQILTS